MTSPISSMIRSAWSKLCGNTANQAGMIVIFGICLQASSAPSWNGHKILRTMRGQVVRQRRDRYHRN
jgi:hypothetical protein